MWSNLPSDLLANVFSFLPPDSLACARSTCRNWHNSHLLSSISGGHQFPPWFIGFPIRNHGTCCYVHNPYLGKWYVLSLKFLSCPIRPIAPVGGLILTRITSTTSLRLGVCNPFAMQFRHLPRLFTTRTNPAVGVVTSVGSVPRFQVYVAGGMSDAPRGGAMYEPTMEMYDSRSDAWEIVGAMPMEFAVRLTVWTPNESVCCNGVLYWMTSARAYSIMGLEIKSNKWRELSVPLADRLEFAALVERNGRLALAGGEPGGKPCVWELNEEDDWCLMDKVPSELGKKMLGHNATWSSTKCVGVNGAICLYRDIGSGMIIWREVEKGRFEWEWAEGCSFVGGKLVQNMPIRGVIMHPTLGPSCFPNQKIKLMSCLSVLASHFRFIG